MHTKYTIMALIIAGSAALSSCSTAYKMGQTPDDVYYSPAKPQSAYASSDNRDEDSYYEANPRRNNRSNQYDDAYYSGYDMYRNDRFLRMSIGNRSRWTGYNDYMMYDGFYNYNRFNIYNDFSFGSPFNSFSYWNSFYNPYSSYGYGYSPYSSYGGPVFIGGGSKYPATSLAPTARPRPFTQSGYTSSFSNNNRYLNSNAYASPSNTNSGRYNNTNSRYNNSNGNSYYNNSNNRTSNSRTNTLRSNTQENSSFYNNNSSNNSSRAYTPSSSSSSGGGSSSSGSGGGVSRPTRGGN